MTELDGLRVLLLLLVLVIVLLPCDLEVVLAEEVVIVRLLVAVVTW